MMYPEDIKVKIKYITKKINNNEQLTEIEKDYYDFYNEFNSYITSLEIEKNLLNYNPDNQTIRKYIKEKDRKTNNALQTTKDSRKQIALKRKLTRIQELKNGNLPLIKYYVEEKYPYDRLNIHRYLFNLLKKNKIIKQNLYTGEISLNRANIIIAKEVIDGNMKNYTNIIELEHTSYKDIDKRKELYNKIPEYLRNANSTEINNIIYYGINIVTPKKTVFAENSSALDILLYVSNLMNNTVKIDYTPEINKFTKTVINDYLNGLITSTDLIKYKVLDYFPKEVNSNKFKLILRSNNYDLDKVLEKILLDDMISKPSFKEYKFINDNVFDIPTLILTSEIVRGYYENYNVLLNSKQNNDIFIISSLPKIYRNINIDNIDRIVHFGNGRIANEDNHELEKDFYDIHILTSIALFEENK